MSAVTIPAAALAQMLGARVALRVALDSGDAASIAARAADLGAAVDLCAFGPGGDVALGEALLERLCRAMATAGTGEALSDPRLDDYWECLPGPVWRLWEAEARAAWSVLMEPAFARAEERRR